jgi:hypothetical protein
MYDDKIVWFNKEKFDWNKRSKGYNPIVFDADSNIAYFLNRLPNEEMGFPKTVKFHFCEDGKHKEVLSVPYVTVVGTMTYSDEDELGEVVKLAVG